MTDNVSLFIEEIGQALVDALYSSLGASLGLKIWEQGTLAHLPAPEDLDDNLPALFVSFENTEQFELFMAHRFRVVYLYRLRYCQRQQDGLNPTREMASKLSQIAAAIASRRFSLPSLDGIPGLDVMKVLPRSIDLANDENSWMSALEVRVSVGHILIAVEAETTAV